jgi:hypothetical protein
MPILRPHLEADAQAQPTPSDRRAKATALLPDITGRVHVALSQAGIDIQLSFLIPNTGDALLIYGTTAEPDPADLEWEQVGEIVCSVVQEVLGVQKLRHREIVCSRISSSSGL